MRIKLGRLFKMVLSVFLVFLITACTVDATAISAPDRLPKDYNKNTGKLIKLNPSRQKSFTSESNTFVIQGNGEEDAEGTEITVYFYNDKTGYYEKKNATKDEDSYSTVVDALGMFRIQVDLVRGQNKLLIYAQKGKKIQTKKISVTFVNKNSSVDFEMNEYSNFADVIRGFSGN